MNNVKQETKGLILASLFQANKFQLKEGVITPKVMIDRYNTIIGVKDRILDNNLSDEEALAVYEVLIEQLLSI